MSTCNYCLLARLKVRVKGMPKPKPKVRIKTDTLGSWSGGKEVTLVYPDGRVEFQMWCAEIGERCEC